MAPNSFINISNTEIQQTDFDSLAQLFYNYNIKLVINQNTSFNQTSKQLTEANFNTLRALNFQHIEMNQQKFSTTLDIQSMISLRLTNVTFSKITTSPSLKYLSLSSLTEGVLTPSLVSSIRSMTELKILNLENYNKFGSILPILPSSLQFLALRGFKQRNLEFLDFFIFPDQLVNCCREFDDSEIDARYQKLASLKGLDVQYGKFKFSDLTPKQCTCQNSIQKKFKNTICENLKIQTVIGNLKVSGLRYLNLSYSKNVNIDGLVGILKLLSLEYFVMQNSQMKADSVYKILQVFYLQDDVKLVDLANNSPKIESFLLAIEMVKKFKQVIVNLRGKQIVSIQDEKQLRQSCEDVRDKFQSLVCMNVCKEFCRKLQFVCKHYFDIRKYKCELEYDFDAEICKLINVENSFDQVNNISLFQYYCEDNM